MGHEEADSVRAIVGSGPATVLVANADRGGVPDPYEHGMEGYRACAALLDEVMPDIARRIGG